MTEGLQLTIPQRLSLLRTVLVLSLIISVLLSFNLWGGERVFPYTPLIQGNPLQAPHDYVYIICALLFWFSALFLKIERLLLFLSFCISVALVLFDLNRMQYWFYVYNAMLFVFLFYNGRVDDANKFTTLFILLQFIVASVYFFCGISQLNANFLEHSFADIISPLKHIMSERQFLFMKKMGVLSPYLFIFTGLGFVITPMRYLSITFAIAFHALLLVFLFPSEKNQNYALWFSNLAFIPIVLLLFSGKTKQRYYSPTLLFKHILFYVIFLLFVVLPFFNINNRYPDYLSFNLKSGNNLSARIKIEKSLYYKLPLYERSFCHWDGSDILFDYEAACLNELKVDCLPSDEIYKSVCSYLESFGISNVKETELIILPKQKLLCKP